MKRFLFFLPVIMLLGCGDGEAPVADNTAEPFVEPEHVSSDNSERLIPRQILFGNPERVGP
jgi:hypothetical protein